MVLSDTCRKRGLAPKDIYADMVDFRMGRESEHPATVTTGENIDSVHHIMTGGYKSNTQYY